MKFSILFFGAFCNGSRNISDAEYQKFYSGVVEVSEIYSFDRFQFKNQVSWANLQIITIIQGELSRFLPLDDDIWGEFFLTLDFFNRKYNFLQVNRNIDEINNVMEFFLMNTFNSDEKEGFQIGTSIFISFWTPDYE